MAGAVKFAGEPTQGRAREEGKANGDWKTRRFAYCVHRAFCESAKGVSRCPYGMQKHWNEQGRSSGKYIQPTKYGPQAAELEEATELKRSVYPEKRVSAILPEKSSVQNAKEVQSEMCKLTVAAILRGPLILGS